MQNIPYLNPLDEISQGTRWSHARHEIDQPDLFKLIILEVAKKTKNNNLIKFIQDMERYKIYQAEELIHVSAYFEKSHIKQTTERYLNKNEINSILFIIKIIKEEYRGNGRVNFLYDIFDVARCMCRISNIDHKDKSAISYCEREKKDFDIFIIEMSESGPLEKMIAKEGLPRQVVVRHQVTVREAIEKMAGYNNPNIQIPDGIDSALITYDKYQTEFDCDLPTFLDNGYRIKDNHTALCCIFRHKHKFENGEKLTTEPTKCAN